MKDWTPRIELIEHATATAGNDCSVTFPLDAAEGDAYLLVGQSGDNSGPNFPGTSPHVDWAGSAGSTTPADGKRVWTRIHRYNGNYAPGEVLSFRPTGDSACQVVWYRLRNCRLIEPVYGNDFNKWLEGNSTGPVTAATSVGVSVDCWRILNVIFKDNSEELITNGVLDNGDRRVMLAKDYFDGDVGNMFSLYGHAEKNDGGSGAFESDDRGCQWTTAANWQMLGFVIVGKGQPIGNASATLMRNYDNYVRSLDFTHRWAVAGWTNITNVVNAGSLQEESVLEASQVQGDQYRRSLLLPALNGYRACGITADGEGFGPPDDYSVNSGPGYDGTSRRHMGWVRWNSVPATANRGMIVWKQGGNTHGWSITVNSTTGELCYRGWTDTNNQIFEIYHPTLLEVGRTYHIATQYDWDANLAWVWIDGVESAQVLDKDGAGEINSHTGNASYAWQDGSIPQPSKGYNGFENGEMVWFDWNYSNAGQPLLNAAIVNEVIRLGTEDVARAAIDTIETSVSLSPSTVPETVSRVITPPPDTQPGDFLINIFSQTNAVGWMAVTDRNWDTVRMPGTSQQVEVQINVYQSIETDVIPVSWDQPVVGDLNPYALNMIRFRGLDPTMPIGSGINVQTTENATRTNDITTGDLEFVMPDSVELMIWTSKSNALEVRELSGPGGEWTEVFLQNIGLQNQGLNMGAWIRPSPGAGVDVGQTYVGVIGGTGAYYATHRMELIPLESPVIDTDVFAQLVYGRL